MKTKHLIVPLLLLPFFTKAQINTNQPSEIVVTPYKTTMIADGKDEALIKITVINKQGTPITDAVNLIHFKITGDAHIASITNGQDAAHNPDEMLQENLDNGQLKIILQTGHQKGIVKLEATGEGLITASTEIHTIQPGIAHPVKTSAVVTSINKINDK